MTLTAIVTTAITLVDVALALDLVLALAIAVYSGNRS